MRVKLVTIRPSQPASLSTAISKPYTDAIIAGIIGATVIAVWFLVLDVIQGRPFYTPTVLGTVIFRGGRGLTTPGTPPASIEMTLMFTWVHGMAFVVVGGIASALLGLAKRDPNLGFGILLLFVILEFGFIAAVFLFEPIHRLIGWPSVLAGNLLAATAMAGYFWRCNRGLKVLP